VCFVLVLLFTDVLHVEAIYFGLCRDFGKTESEGIDRTPTKDAFLLQTITVTDQTKPTCWEGTKVVSLSFSPSESQDETRRKNRQRLSREIWREERRGERRGEHKSKEQERNRQIKRRGQGGKERRERTTKNAVNK